MTRQFKTDIKNREKMFFYITLGMQGSVTKVEVIKKAFILLLQDFFKSDASRKNNLELLEAFAGQMFYSSNHPDDFKNIDPELGKVLDLASDITYYSDMSKEKRINFEDRIKIIRRYYLDNKSIT